MLSIRTKSAAHHICITISVTKKKFMILILLIATLCTDTRLDFCRYKFKNCNVTTYTNNSKFYYDVNNYIFSYAYRVPISLRFPSKYGPERAFSLKPTDSVAFETTLVRLLLIINIVWTRYKSTHQLFGRLLLPLYVSCCPPREVSVGYVNYAVPHLRREYGKIK